MPGVDLVTQLGTTPWTDVDGAALTRALQRARFDLMGVVSRRALCGDITAGNAEVKALVDSVPQMRGWAVVNPAYPERSSEEMRKYLGSAKWLGAALYPQMVGQRLNTVSAREVINAYRRYTKPLLVSVPNGDAVRDLEELATEFNTMKFVAAGAGGDQWQDAMFAAKRAVNIFLEPFSGGAHRGKLEALLATLGPNRVLFASNHPERNPGSSIGILLDSRLSETERQGVLSGNATRLFSFLRAQ
ncbi:MAG: amidohydrolase family protein [Armatimonadota bacterium]